MARLSGTRRVTGSVTLFVGGQDPICPRHSDRLRCSHKLVEFIDREKSIANSPQGSLGLEFGKQITKGVKRGEEAVVVIDDELHAASTYIVDRRIGRSDCHHRNPSRGT